MHKVLPDDTLEYWGFYLMKGATVELKVCSRYDGSRILVVKGQRNLRTCGLMDHNKNKFGANFNPEQSQVKVTFETAAEIVVSSEINLKEENMKFAENVVPDDEVSLNHGGEDFTDLEDEARKKHKDFAANYRKVDKNAIPSKNEKPQSETVKKHDDNKDNANQNPYQHENKSNITKIHRKRHKHLLDEQNYNKDENMRRRRSNKDQQAKPRARRDTRLDGGINHGGNAKSFIHKNESDSTSSFEMALFECYDGDILLAESFPPSKICNDVQSLEQGSHLVTKHEVNSDGYYYYIFYSDNDYESNGIHAVFDIYKPTYLYSNISETKGCVNSTECRFPIQL